MRGDARLPEVGQQLVQLDDQEALLGHGVEVAVQAVDDDDGGAAVLDGPADGVGELARRQLGRVDLLHGHAPGVDVLPQVDPQAGGAGQQRVEALVEDEQRRVLAALGRRRHELRGQRRLAGPGRADDQRAGAALDAAAEQGVQLGDAAGELFHDWGRAVLAGDQARKDLDAPRAG